MTGSIFIDRCPAISCKAPAYRLSWRCLQLFAGKKGGHQVDLQHGRPLLLGEVVLALEPLVLPLRTRIFIGAGSGFDKCVPYKIGG